MYPGALVIWAVVINMEIYHLQHGESTSGNLQDKLQTYKKTQNPGQFRQRADLSFFLDIMNMHRFFLVPPCMICGRAQSVKQHLRAN